MDPLKNSKVHPGRAKSILWLLLTVACFQVAYGASSQYPAAGYLIAGYAFGLIKLAEQPSVRRAFYLGLAAGVLCAAPQLTFLWSIFSFAAIVLWIVFAFLSDYSPRLFAAASGAGLNHVPCGAFQSSGRVWSIFAVNFTT